MRTGGLSQARLRRLHDVLAGYVERGEVPGLVAMVWRRGELHVEAIGLARDAIFRIASLTKPVTAAAAMVLVEEGKLRLDDPVDALLPELAKRRVLTAINSPLDDTVSAHRPITLRDVLTFRLGIGVVMVMPGTYPIQRAIDDLVLGQGPPTPSLTPAPDEWIRRLGTLPLMHQPGERWLYNTGSDVLAVLVRRASGQPFDVFLEERLFRPLGMKDTAFSVPPEKLGRLADSFRPYRASSPLEYYDRAAGGHGSRPPAFPSGTGGLVSTADDFLSFSLMLLSMGKQAAGKNALRILSRPSVELMTADHLTPAQKAVSGLLPGSFDDHGWGFGMSVVTRRYDVAKSVGTYGWDGGLGTTWYVDPREEMVTILFTQRMMESPAPPPVFRDFWTLAWQAIDD